MSQGQGPGTEWKEKGFSRLLEEDLFIFKNGARPGRKFFHFDLMAGRGWNGSIAGSPLVWLAATGKTGVEDWRGWFVEMDPDRSTRLVEELVFREHAALGWEYPVRGEWEVECMDCREFIPKIPDLIAATGEDPRYAIGSVLADPNGHDDMPLKELAWLGGKCERLDLILNWNAAAVKRWLGYYLKRGDPRAATKTRLKDGIHLLGKKYWLIREPVEFWQFSILFGTNYERRDYRRLGFYDIRSQHGRSIVERLNYTEKERAGRYQGVLF